jgi:hypothetical protein
MAAWEARHITTEEMLGAFVSSDVPVPHLGHTLHLPEQYPFVVVRVHHYPASRLVKVYVSPMPTSPVPVGGRLS